MSTLPPKTIETINTLEQTSIKALVAYTAHERKVTEDVVRDVFSNRFKVQSIDKLPRESFDDAIRFLVDVQIELLQ
jgi:hypothetical protein